MKQLLLLVFLVALIPSAYAIEVSVNAQDPAPAEAGKPLNVWIKVDNPTDVVESDVFIDVTPQDGLQLSAGESARKRIGVLAAGGSQTVQYRMFVRSTAAEGPNNVEVDIVKPTGDITFDILVEVEEDDSEEVILEVGNIQSEPTRIKPDDEFVKLDVTLQNLGEATARGVKTTLRDLPEGVSFSESYSNLELIGNIEEDDTAIASFFIDVEETVKPGLYEANLDISYKYKPDPDEEEFLVEDITLPVSLSIKSIPLYEITAVQVKEPLRAGDKDVELQLTIKNIGEEDGESVRVRVFAKSEQPFDFGVSSNFVAPKLLPGESAQTTLEFDVDDDADLQEYLLDFEVKNVVDEDVVTYSKTVAVTVHEPKQNSPMPIIVVGGIILVGVILGIRWFRKRQSKKPSKRVRHKYERSHLE